MRNAGLIRRWELALARTIGAFVVVLSLSLAGMVWLVYRAVDSTSAILIQGQGARFTAAAHDWFRALRRPVMPGDFDAFLPQHWPQGLRYVAFIDTADGAIIADAGQPAAPLDEKALEALRFMAPARIGERVRLMLGPGLRGGPFGDPLPPEAWRPPALEEAEGRGGGARPFGPPRHPPTVVVEFEPLEADQMQAYARRTVTVGLIATPLFLIGGVLLAIVVSQRDALARRLEHQRRLAALGEMAAVIAHEIRNPLTSLKGHAQLLQRALSGDERAEKVERVVAEAKRLDSLLADLLEFARTGAIEPRAVDPARVLRECAEAVHAERIVLRTDGAPESWRMDPERMGQALVNVLRNAVQISPADAPVEACAFADGDRLVYEVRDHGSGIAAGDEEQIFEPFFTRKARGTGLGLALARRIVAQHRGTITACNRPGGGALFRIALERL